MSSNLVRLLALSLVCAVVAACSSEAGKAKPASLVAVKVNGDELSVPQVNAQLVRLASLPEGEREAARRQVVDGLVDQQLLVQRAREIKLDRDPEVLAATEASRVQILAQAYVQKTIAAKARPTAEEVRSYYAAHPELFAARRVYRLQEVATDMPPERSAELEKAVAAAKGVSEVVEHLRRAGFRAAVNTAVRTAEALPMQSLPRISAMKDGEMAVIGNGRQLTVLQVTASQSQPLDEKQATPYIEQYLLGIKREELVKGEVERLREKAKIDYVGDFAKLYAAAAAASAPQAAPAAAASQPLSKGLSGLR